MNPSVSCATVTCGLVLWSACLVATDAIEQDCNTWVKRSPLPGAPVSPRLGYEGDCRWDPFHRLLIRYGGHNQGGGGEQGSEVWLFDPVSASWSLREPDLAPPGVCCEQQNVIDTVRDRYVRFPSFSGSHGWQWFREIYLNDSSVWSYDIAENRWRNLRPVPAPRVHPLRCASWDSDHGLVVLFGGEGSSEGTLVYDPATNEWIRPRPPSEPPERSGGNMCYDSKNRRHVLFGAQFTDDPRVWLYDLPANRWESRRSRPMPPTDRNDAVITFDVRHGVVIAVVKATEGEGDDAGHRLETWTYDVAGDAWRKMDPPREPDPSGNRARQLTFAPSLNLAILENRTRRPPEQQIWTYRYAEARGIDPLVAPDGLRAVTASDAVTLRWSPAGDGAAVGYRVYRGRGERPHEVSFERVGEISAEETSWSDPVPGQGEVWHYAVSAVGAGGREGRRSAPVRTRPPVVEDVIVSVLGRRRVEITWAQPAAKDIVGYHLERARVEVLSEDQLVRLERKVAPLEPPSVGAITSYGPFRRLTGSPVAATAFTDETVDLADRVSPVEEPIQERRFHPEQLDDTGKPCAWAVLAYRVRAVNALGLQGGPSPATLTIPAPPRNVFAREDGARCDLRWDPHPARGIRGHRIYRLDGRWEGDTISRLTPLPVEGERFTDTEAGDRTRRYHVVAVDVLGHEGFPSAPVWANREWRRFYEPFVGEWHQ